MGGADESNLVLLCEWQMTLYTPADVPEGTALALISDATSELGTHTDAPRGAPAAADPGGPRRSGLNRREGHDARPVRGAGSRPTADATTGGIPTYTGFYGRITQRCTSRRSTLGRESSEHRRSRSQRREASSSPMRRGDTPHSSQRHLPFSDHIPKPPAADNDMRLGRARSGRRRAGDGAPAPGMRSEPGTAVAPFDVPASRRR